MSWRRSGASFELSARIPVGADAEIHVPLVGENPFIAEGETMIWKEGAAAELPAEISFLRKEGPYAVFSAGSGHYFFRSENSRK